MITFFVFSSLNLTSLSLPHFSTFVKSMVRSKAEVLRYGEIFEYARCCGLDEKDELKDVSSAKEKILEDVEESRSFMTMMKRTGEIKEP